MEQQKVIQVLEEHNKQLAGGLLVQSKEREKLEKKVEELTKLVNFLMKTIEYSVYTEDRFGILVEAKDQKKLLINNDDEWFSDVSCISWKNKNNKIQPSSLNLNESDLYHEVIWEYCTQIDGSKICGVCCNDETIVITPKSNDLQGLLDLQALEKRLKNENRINHNDNIDFLNKECSCT